MKKVILVSMAVLALSFTLMAQKAEKKMDKKPCGDCKGQDMMMKQEHLKSLELTKEQQKKIETLREEHMKIINTKKAAIENMRIDKHKAMKDENYAKVKQLNKAISDARLEIANHMTDHKQAVMKELTPEQKEKMKNMHMKNEKMMRKDKPCGDKMMGKDKPCGDKMMKDDQMGREKPCMSDCK